MVTLESALSSVNLDSYIDALSSKNYTFEAILALSPSQIEDLTSELQMKKGHIVRFKNLVDTLRPIFNSVSSENGSTVPQSPTQPAATRIDPAPKEVKAQEIITIEDSPPRTSTMEQAQPKHTESAPAIDTREQSKAFVGTIKAEYPIGAKKTPKTPTLSDLPTDTILPAKRNRSDETNKLENDALGMRKQFDGLKNMLEGYMNKRNKVFEVMHSIAILDLESYERALEEIKMIKSIVKDYLNKGK